MKILIVEDKLALSKSIKDFGKVFCTIKKWRQLFSVGAIWLLVNSLVGYPNYFYNDIENILDLCV